jgi:hypothetical protein
MPDDTTHAGTSKVHDDDVGRIVADYEIARPRLDALLKEAAEVGGHLERLGRGLSTHPERMVIAQSDEHLGDTAAWDVISSQSLPTIDALIALTDNIRDTAARVDDLRERLILLGHLELVEPPAGFFQ